MNKNLAIRTAVAAVAIPIILWACYQGGIWLWDVVTILMVTALGEFLLAEGYSYRNPGFWLLLLSTVLYMAHRGIWLIIGVLPDEVITILSWPDQMFSLYLLIFLLSGMIFSVGKRDPSELFNHHARLTWGITYLYFLYPYVISIRSFGENGVVTPSSPGADWLLFLFGLLWLGDTTAMFIGKVFGRHKLAPTVSPNKTVEGFVGGILGAVAVAVILAFWRLDMVPIWQLVVIAILCSVFGQLGDLVESMWKRSLNLKDSSSLIPGHGGVLDRFDSLLFAAPVMYHLAKWLELWRF